MIGIVIVSHSLQLATGLAELTRQMVQDAVPLAVAAGIEDPENPLGTDAIAISEAIGSIYSEDGVLVLVDLGSAILSTEMAWEFLDSDQQAKVKLCAAPLVEGTIAAAVQAATGASLDDVKKEAENALKAKITQLLGSETETLLPDIPHSTGIKSEIYLKIENSMGLHARPAAKLVTTASQFESEITLQNLTKGTQPVNAKSINQAVTLGVVQGDEIAIAATGNDASAALTALEQLVADRFGESEPDLVVNHATMIPTHSHLSSNTLSGIPISPGVAIAPVVFYQLPVFQVEIQQTENSEAEWQEFCTAVDTCIFEIQQIRQQTAQVTGEAEAKIFDAHILYLSDPTLLEDTKHQIFANRLTAAAGWQTVINQTIATYHGLENSYLKERATDLFDVGQRVLGLLSSGKSVKLELSEKISEPSMLVAPDLTPSQIAQLDLTKIVGICTVHGSPLSHVAILARSQGIPAVFGIGSELLQIKSGQVIAMNGETGQVWLNPDSATISELETQRNHELSDLKSLQTAAQHPTYTSDNHLIPVMANISSVDDVKIAQKNGADGVGLLRTELLDLDRHEPPTEAEQVEIYRAIAQGIFPHSLTIRVLDIGGDKPLPFLTSSLHSRSRGNGHQKTDNSMLGWRGIRVLLDFPDLLKIQLKAILQVSDRYPINILLPMVASVAEIRAAKQILTEAKAELTAANIPFNDRIPIGIMIEVPAAVTMADRLAAEVDFFSIGTNDLSQYIMAADRTNSKVAHLADSFQPAVLRMIQQTVKAAHKIGISVSVCGELASEVLAIPILLGLGVDTLSINSPRIPKIKAAISQLSMTEAEKIARTVLELDSAQSVKEYLMNPFN